MKKYSISYDLNKPNQNYTGLIDRLIALGAVKIEYSHWLLIGSQLSAAAIRDDLARFLDANDRIFVAGLTGEAAWRNLMASDEKVKKTLVA